MTRKELLSSNEYWIGEIQFHLFKIINEYMEENKINRTQLAEKFGFTKGYISQILNGEFNHRISKLVELALAVGKVPIIEFKDLDQIIIDDMNEKPEEFKNIEQNIKQIAEPEVRYNQK
jgi:transcriptional regulator with XRE-family HTH domain